MVMVELLMHGLKLKKVGRGAMGSNQALAWPRDSGGIIQASGVDGRFATAEKRNVALLLDEGAGKLEVQIGDGALRVGSQYQVLHNIGRERSLPEV
jgi:hypothetical protein